MNFEMELHKSCSVPFGFAAVTLPAALSPQQHQQQAQQAQAAQSQQQQQQQPLAPSNGAAGAAAVAATGPFQAAPWSMGSDPFANAAFNVGASSLPAPGQFVFGARRSTQEHEMQI